MRPVNFDVRVKLLILVFVNVTATLQQNLQSEIFLILAITIFYIIQGKISFSVKGLSVYMTLLFLTLFFGRYQNLFLGVVVFTLIAMKKLFPIVFFASGIVSTSRFGQILFALQSFRLPKKIVIMLSIVFRFFPSFSRELMSNRNALKLRAYQSSGLTGRLNDLMFFSIIPLMRRAELVADELSQAAVLRGIENPVNRTSMFAASLKLEDLLALSCFMCLFIYSWVM